MKTNETAIILDEISEKHLRKDLNLLPEIFSKIEYKNQTYKKVKNRFALSMMTILAVCVLLFTIPEVAAAARKMLGFIPGIGLVNQDDSLRVLSQPVVKTRKGFTLTVEDAVLDRKHTVITYKVEGPFLANSELSNTCFSAPELHLSDGTVYKVTSELPVSFMGGYRVQYNYPSLPADQDKAVLVFPCLFSLPLGSGPQNWKIPLSFLPASDDLVIYPIGSEESSSAMKTGQQSDGISIDLENVIPLEDGQLVQIRVDWHNNPEVVSVKIDPDDVEIYDGSGKRLYFDPSTEALDPGAFDLQSQVFGYKTSLPTDFSAARLVITAASQITFNSFATFEIDPSASSDEEQLIPLDKEIILDGRVLRIKNVTFQRNNGNAGISVEMESPDGIVAAGVHDNAHPAISGANSDVQSADGNFNQFWTSFNYAGDLPPGPITLTITSYTVRQPGSWTVDWSPVAPPENPTTNQGVSTNPCLNNTIWESVMADHADIPEQLTKKVLFEYYDPGTSTNQIVLGSLDGDEFKILIEDGYNPALSPDGKAIAFTDKEGNINIFNIITGTTRLLTKNAPNTGLVMLFWSPDGKWIAFTGTPIGSSPDLYLINPDNSESVLLKETNLPKLIQGWTPDGNIVFITLDKSGPVLQQINPQTKEISTLFMVQNLATTISISRGGNQFALIGPDDQNHKPTLSVYGNDGVVLKKLLQVEEDGFILSARFTPDDQWLSVYFDWSVPSEPYSQVLINPITCQVIPLENMPGQIFGWLP